MNPQNKAIEVVDVTVDYETLAGTVRALDCSRLEVAPGGSLAVMGPSGCGKSTLLGLLAGLALPTTGTVTIGTETISTLNERDRVRFRRRNLGMVYQADNLLPHLTIEENVGLQQAICRNRADPTDEAGSEAALERLGISALRGRLPDELSGGQRQRAAVARAVIHRPSVILADEPTGALDDVNAAAVIELLVDVQRELDATLVMVSHDPQMADHLDRIVHLSQPTPQGVDSHAD